MTSLSPPKNDAVYQSLKRLVASQALKPGDRLPAMRKLAQDHNVNVNTVYAAVRRLGHDGLVVSRHGQGVFVAEAQNQTRNVLLLNRTEGHMWSDLTQRFVERYSQESQFRLMVDMVPDEQSGRLPMFREKLQSLDANKIDTVVFNGIAEGNINHVYDDIPPGVQKLCVYSRTAIPGRNVGGVVSDWYHGGYVAAKHLVEVGCRNIVAIIPNRDGQSGEFARGTDSAAKDSVSGVSINTFTCRGFAADTEGHLDELLKQYPKVDGILTHGDFVAAPLIKSLRGRGVSVPDDVAVVGYYNTPWVDLCEPSLTSVDTRWTNICDIAVDMAMSGDFYTQAVIHPRLIVRDSSRRS